MTRQPKMAVNEEYMNLSDVLVDLDRKSAREIRQLRTAVFATRFNHALRVRGFTQLDFFAQICKLSYAKVAAWSSGYRMPKPQDFGPLCDRLEVTEAWLKGEVPKDPIDRRI
jgi:hypothetical protein